MEQERRLLVIDSDYGYIRQLESEMIRRFGSRVRIHIITDLAYLENYFCTPRKTDMVVADSALYDAYLQQQEIRHILLLRQGPEREDAVDNAVDHPAEGVRILEKEGPAERIFDQLEAWLAEEEPKPQERPIPQEKPETRVIGVYSPIGGCGKSLVALALGRKLRKLDQTVLVVGCDSLQSFAAFLPTERYADDSLADKLKQPDEDTYWTVLQNIDQDEVSYLLPFEKIMPSLGIGTEELKTLLQLLREKKDFSYVILDLGTCLNEQTLALMEESDAYILLAEASEISNKKLKRLQNNLSLLPNKQCFLISNQYHADGRYGAGKNFFGQLARYGSREEAMEDPVFYRLALELCR